MPSTHAGEAAPAAYSITQFCAAHSISRATFYNLVKAGASPRIMQVGKRRLISREAAADWRSSVRPQPRSPPWQLRCT